MKISLGDRSQGYLSIQAARNFGATAPRFTCRPDRVPLARLFAM